MTVKTDQSYQLRFAKSIRYGLFSLWVIGGLFGSVGAAHAQQKTLPPEVKSMIGMKLPPKLPGKKTAETPNFNVYGSGTIGVGGISLGFVEGVAAGRWPVFYIQRTSPDLSVEILDVQLLPSELIEWRFADGAFRHVKGRYRLSDYCKIGDEDRRRIFGLVKPEADKTDCAHFSWNVKKAWEIEAPTGRIVPMSTTTDLQCHYLTMNSCY